VPLGAEKELEAAALSKPMLAALKTTCDDYHKNNNRKQASKDNQRRKTSNDGRHNNATPHNTTTQEAWATRSQHSERNVPCTAGPMTVNRINRHRQQQKHVRNEQTS